MPYIMSWFKEGRIALIRIEGSIPVDEIKQSSIIIVDEFLNAGEKPVHLICDVTELTAFPTNIMAVKQSTDMILAHPSLGWMVFVGFKNPVARFLAGTISQAMRIRFQQVNTLDEALRLLGKVDASVADSNT